MRLFSADAYEIIEGLDSYDAAIGKLKASFIKTPNVIFCCHQLATRKQKAGEPIAEFLQALRIMSKDCRMWNVSAEESRWDLVRDAFTNGLAFHHIRQRLLKSNEYTVDQVFNKTRSLFQTQECSATYTLSMSGKNSAAASAMRTEDNSKKEAEIDSSPVVSGEILAFATILGGRKCHFRALTYHRRADCPAKEVICHSCEKLGHFSRICRSTGTKPTKKLFVEQRKINGWKKK